MFSLLQWSVSLWPLPMAPTEAMLSLLFRFAARRSVGTPKTTAPPASVVVLRKLRRLSCAGEDDFDRFMFVRYIGTTFDGFGANMVSAIIALTRREPQDPESS